MSMFDDMNQMRAEGIANDVAAILFEQWCDANLDEGTMYADYQICHIFGDPELQKEFNEFYKANKGDELYFEVEQ